MEKGKRKQTPKKNIIDAVAVIDITYKNKYVYDVLFQNGERADIDFLPAIKDHRVLKQLLNKNLFKSAWVQCGTVVWSDELDIAPEWIWEQAGGTALGE